MPDILHGMAHPDSFGARATLEVGGEKYEIFRLDALQSKYDVARLPYSIKILLENLLRFEDGEAVTAEDVENVAKWVAKDEPSKEIAYTPARVLMQDFTGVPAVVDLAAMRDAMDDMGGDASKINPLVPAELVIDHSIQVDEFATKFAFKKNAELEFQRNRERYEFLRWGQEAFDDFAVVPPNTGICHQVNLEYLARVVYTRDGQAFPDTLVGTDSHTTMINGLGVLGWGVGGIEAEAAMLGQPISMLLPQVVGFRLTGELPEGATATDLVLTVTQMLRERGVVVEVRRVLRPGPRQPAARRPRDDRQHVARVRRHLRHLPGRRGDAPLPRVQRPPEGADRAGRGLHQGAGPLPRRGHRGGDLLRHARARPRRPWSRRSPAPSARRTACRCARPTGFRRRGPGDTASRDRATTRRWSREFPASDPPARRGPGDAAPAETAVAPPGSKSERRSSDGEEFELEHGPRGDRGDHELHQHLEPVGDARRRPAGEEGGRARPADASPGSRRASRRARRSSPSTSTRPA